MLNGGQFSNQLGTFLASGTSTVGTTTVGNNIYLQNNAVISGGLLKTAGGAVIETVGGQAATLDGSSQGALHNAGTYVGTNNSTTFLSGVINNTGSLASRPAATSPICVSPTARHCRVAGRSFSATARTIGCSAR